MRSDKSITPKPEWINNDGSGIRLFAYTCAISGKEGGALPSQGKAKGGTGITGLMKELEKTKLDV